MTMPFSTDLVQALCITAALGACATAGGRVSWSGVDANVYDDAADADWVRSCLSATRADAGRGPALPFSVAQENLKHAKQRISEGYPPDGALEFSLQSSAATGERDIQYWTIPTNELGTLKFPEALLVVKRLNVAIAVFRGTDKRKPRYHVVLATPSLHENHVE